MHAATSNPPRAGRASARFALPQDIDCAISCRDINVRFFTDRRSVTAIEGLSLDIAAGEFLTLLGPSGCGKSTFLRVVADLVKPSRGSVSVLGAAPQAARERRDIGFVFQDAALLPWRTAIQNVALPLEVAHGKARAGRATPRELLELVGLKGREDAFPHEMSGGMRQRVAIARALVCDPKVLLMDEPFGALDEITRDRLNEELRRVWKELGLTTLFVTHSIYEAAFLGQRVLMLAANPGRVKEIVPVDLPEDRTLDIRETREFVELTAHLRRVLETC
ncbi:ABC transporter ATP-binding protein [Caballeronia novacaledonica]|uniref:ABC transporter ATP-binding protein n=1 Tax=Caballeronia novacaledonica TaxID=1544861 RepID=A0A2U3I2I7_9BURK|nr:ABC transporter ATP-binding protein [Caballeronia novacaledonica]SPB14346.1 ABC transporter ATP-binding protein [Caballeronia novacaledonica]